MKQKFYSAKNTIVLIAICLATLMFSLEISSVPVILPTLEKVLNANLKDMQWIMNIYTIGCTTVLMAAGTLADRYGRKRILIITLILFGISSLICGLAENIALLIISRFFQGISGGAMLICQVATLSHQFQKGKERSKAFGIWGIILGVGLGFGPIIGGSIIAILSWQWVFLIHVPIALLAVILVYGYVDESKDSDAKNRSLGHDHFIIVCFWINLFYYTRTRSWFYQSNSFKHYNPYNYKFHYIYKSRKNKSLSNV